MNKDVKKYQEALNTMRDTIQEIDMRTDVCTNVEVRNVISATHKLQELVYKNAILMNDNIQNLLKSFLPYEEPYCSSCMFYTESDCDTKNKCYLKMLFKALDWSEYNER